MPHGLIIVGGVVVALGAAILVGELVVRPFVEQMQQERMAMSAVYEHELEERRDDTDSEDEGQQQQQHGEEENDVWASGAERWRGNANGENGGTQWAGEGLRRRGTLAIDAPGAAGGSVREKPPPPAPAPLPLPEPITYPSSSSSSGYTPAYISPILDTHAIDPVIFTNESSRSTPDLLTGSIEIGSDTDIMSPSSPSSSSSAEAAFLPPRSLPSSEHEHEHERSIATPTVEDPFADAEVDSEAGGRNISSTVTLRMPTPSSSSILDPQPSAPSTVRSQTPVSSHPASIAGDTDDFSVLSGDSPVGSGSELELELESASEGESREDGQDGEEDWERMSMSGVSATGRSTAGEWEEIVRETVDRAAEKEGWY